MEELSLLRAAGAVVSLGVSNPGTDPGLELLFSHLRSLGGSVLRSFGEVDILQQRWPWGSSACTPLPPPLSGTAPGQRLSGGRRVSSGRELRLLPRGPGIPLT